MKRAPQHSDLPFGDATAAIAHDLGCEPYNCASVVFGDVEARKSTDLDASFITGTIDIGNGREFKIPAKPGYWVELGSIEVSYLLPSVNTGFGAIPQRFAGGDIAVGMTLNGDTKIVGMDQDPRGREATEHAQDVVSSYANDRSVQELNSELSDRNSPMAKSGKLPYVWVRSGSTTGIGGGGNAVAQQLIVTDPFFAPGATFYIIKIST